MSDGNSLSPWDAGSEAFSAINIFSVVANMQSCMHRMESSIAGIETNVSSLQSACAQNTQDVRSLQSMFAPQSFPACSGIADAPGVLSHSDSSKSLTVTSSSASAGANPGCEVSSCTASTVLASASDGAVLLCPFCPKRHLSEKSHCQHMRRLVQRVSSGTYYQGRCRYHSHVQYAVLQKYAGEGALKLQNFVDEYVGFLHASCCGIDVGRLSRLREFLDSCCRMQ
jgi:hypothetical protein